MRLMRRLPCGEGRRGGDLAQALGVEVRGLSGADQRDASRLPAVEGRQEQLERASPELAALSRLAHGAAAGLVQAGHRSRRGTLPRRRARRADRCRRCLACPASAPQQRAEQSWASSDYSSSAPSLRRLSLRSYGGQVPPSLRDMSALRRCGEDSAGGYNPATMSLTRNAVLAALLAATAIFPGHAQQPQPRATAQTALDRYVAAPDPSFSWKVLKPLAGRGRDGNAAGNDLAEMADRSGGRAPAVDPLADRRPAREGEERRGAALHHRRQPRTAAPVDARRRGWSTRPGTPAR